MMGGRSDQLTTHDLHVLDEACGPIRVAFGGPPYLVGSAGIDGTEHPRDVDVRLILDDEEFDALLPTRKRWTLLSLALGDYLRQRTGLPIDFQIQRATEANLRFNKPRNPLGMGRSYAAGGDATPWTPRSKMADAELEQQMEQIRDAERKADRDTILAAQPSQPEER